MLVHVRPPRAQDLCGRSFSTLRAVCETKREELCLSIQAEPEIIVAPW